MTISYKGGAIFVPRTIKTKTEETIGKNFTRTIDVEVRMVPGDTSDNDRVEIYSETINYAKPHVFKGQEINSPECKTHGVGWIR